MKFLVSFENNKRSVLNKVNQHRNISLNISNAALSYIACASVLEQHNKQVFKYFQFSNIALKIPAHTFNGLANKFVALNTKKGFKHKAYARFSMGLQSTLKNFEDYNTDLSESFIAYAIFFDFAQNFSSAFYSPTFMLAYIYNYLELIFVIKRVRPHKKKKKKRVSKTLISYIPSRFRANTTLRIVNTYIKWFDARNYTDRINYALLYLFLAGKDSFLYKKKIIMYNKLLEKKKFY